MSLIVLALAAAIQPADPEPAVYGAGALIPATFSLDERTREGGRLTPIFSAYRPNVSFEGGPRVICRFTVHTEGGHAPGESGDIEMTCPVGAVEGQHFEAFERERPIGSGVVTAPR